MNIKGQQPMDEEVLNINIRKFLKKLGIKSQREIEQAITTAVDRGQLIGNEKLMARAQITLEGTEMDLTLYEEISLTE